MILNSKNKGYYFIAEIGVNYYDIAVKLNITLMEAAKLMCSKAKTAGLDAVKFQSYKAETLASRYSPAYWDTSEETTKSQFELFKKFDLFQEREYQELADYCNQLDIDFISTPFDFASADYLEPLLHCYKISSSDLNNIPFIRHLARKGKPIILSTGAATPEEIHSAVSFIRSYNREPLVLLHCVLEYPTPPSHASLNRIDSLKKEFPDLIIGYSDHTKPDDSYMILQTAYILGAQVIEKHFTLDKTLPGNDHYHAMDDQDAIQIISKFDYINKIRGNYGLQYNETEVAARKYARRSIVALNKLKSGEFITEQNITLKRPGTGISPEHWDEVIGKKVKNDISEDQILEWDDIE